MKQYRSIGWINGNIQEIANSGNDHELGTTEPLGNQ